MFIKGICAVALAATASVAGASTVMVGSPAAWRLQNYTTDSIEVYYTPATCSTGRLILSGSMTVSDKDRFWSLVLSAKLTGRDVGVVYDMVSSDCVVQSFFLP